MPACPCHGRHPPRQQRRVDNSDGQETEGGNQPQRGLVLYKPSHASHLISVWGRRMTAFYGNMAEWNIKRKAMKKTTLHTLHYLPLFARVPACCLTLHSLHTLDMRAYKSIEKMRRGRKNASYLSCLMLSPPPSWGARCLSYVPFLKLYPHVPMSQPGSPGLHTFCTLRGPHLWLAHGAATSHTASTPPPSAILEWQMYVSQYGK